MYFDRWSFGFKRPCDIIQCVEFLFAVAIFPSYLFGFVFVHIGSGLYCVVFYRAVLEKILLAQIGYILGTYWVQI